MSALTWDDVAEAIGEMFPGADFTEAGGGLHAVVLEWADDLTLVVTDSEEAFDHSTVGLYRGDAWHNGEDAVGYVDVHYRGTVDLLDAITEADDLPAAFAAAAQ